MLQTIKGMYEKGHIKLLEKPQVTGKAHVIVTFLSEDRDNFHECLQATETSLDFWNNEVDDEVWNNA